MLNTATFDDYLPLSDDENLKSESKSTGLPLSDPCVAGDELAFLEQLSRQFGGFYGQIYEKIASYQDPSDDSGNGNPLHDATEELGRQWREQEVTAIIDQIGKCLPLAQGHNIAARLNQLRSLVKEEDGPEADLSPESLRAFHQFIRGLGGFRHPEISLTPGSEIYVRWKDGPAKLFAMHFQDDRNVRFAAFSPNPRHPHLVRRLSGTETVDTALDTADRACSIKEWGL